MVVGRSKGRHVIPVDLLMPRRLLASWKKNIWFVGSHMLDGAKLNSMSFLLFSFTRRTSHGFSASPLLLGFSCHKAEGSEAVVVVMVVWNCERESFDSLQRIPGFQTFYWTTTTTECVCSLLSIQQRHTRIPWQGCLKGVRDGKLWLSMYINTNKVWSDTRSKDLLNESDWHLEGSSENILWKRHERENNWLCGCSMLCISALLSFEVFVQFNKSNIFGLYCFADAAIILIKVTTNNVQYGQKTS